MAGARYIEYVEAGAQNGPPKEVYAQIERDFGQVADPIRIHSPVPRVLTGAWVALRETALAGGVPRGVKEAVAVGVSETNACSYCADAHGMMLEAAGHRNAGDAIRRGGAASIADARVRDAARWALETRKPGAELLKKPPFPASDLPEIAGTAVVFHYVNRMVSVFLPPSPFPVGGLLKGLVGKVGGKPFAEAMKRPKAPGEALRFLPEAELPPELAWAAPNATVAGALARLASVVEEQGKRSLPENLRACLAARAALWRGEALSPSDIEEALASLSPPEAKLAGRLLMLSAFAPERVTEKTVKEFRSRFLIDGGDADRRLVGAVSWAAWQAAKRIGSWLGAGR